MIKGIICDLDGGYFTGGKENFIKEVVLTYKADEEVIRTIFYSSDLMQQYKRGQIDDNFFWEEFIKRAHIQASRDDLVGILINGYEPEEKIVNLIRSLRSHDYETIICSNNFPARVNGLDIKYSFTSNFTVTVFSYEVGKLKLEGFDMYKKVLSLSRLSAEQIVMFDNGPANLAHAKAFGFATILFQNYVQLMEELEQLGISA